MLFTIDEVTPAREHHCPPEILGCFVHDVRRFQQAVEKMDDYMDREITVPHEESGVFEAAEQKMADEIDRLDIRIRMAQDWLEHLRHYGIYDDVQTFSEFEADVADVRANLERVLAGAKEGLSQPAAFHHILRIYGLLYQLDDVAAYTLHDADEITGEDCYHRPEMGLVGAWTKKQIGDFLYAVIQKMKNPVDLLTSLSGWERGVVKEIIG